jgi:2-keto-4-pentenoate hydratase/2-oxohepta-3-ene-1,7-dioic acid hydratase in catechol pathway
MRILRFFDNDGTVHAGVREGDMVADLGACGTLEAAGASLEGAPRRPVAGLKLDAPIRAVPKLMALAGNYRKHIVESGYSADVAGPIVTPQVFWKPSTAIVGPGAAIPLRANNVFLDWEAELGVIIGRRVKDARPEDAMAAVFGYTVINDISERSFNSRIENRRMREVDPYFDWLIGKWFDGSAPMGPEIVTADEIADPHDLDIRLWVNDALMQDSNTSHMIFNIPETIAYISSVLTLEPGDVIATGTPEGVGKARGIDLKDGDKVRVEIECIGTLENTVVREG